MLRFFEDKIRDPTGSQTRASASRPSGEWNDDDYDVVADGGGVLAFLLLYVIIGRLRRLP